MTPKTKNILKKILAYSLMTVVLMLTYIVVSFLLDTIFRCLGDEEGISWISMVSACVFATAAIIIVDILNSRKKGVDRSDDIIRICRRILTTTTFMFCVSLAVEWLIQRFSDKDLSLGLVHWLSFSFAVAIFDRLVVKFKEKKMHQTKRLLIIIISLSCSGIYNVTSAQTPSHFPDDVYLVPNPQTARWSYTETDGNGKQTATIYQSVESMEGDAVNGNIKLRVEKVPVTSPADTIKSFIFYRFKEGEYMVDMNAVFEGDVLASLAAAAIQKEESDISEEEMKEAFDKMKSQFRISGEIRGIPRYPKVGTLPHYEFQFKFSIMNMKVLGEERRIIGTERIQTEAGSFDCFIMEETVTTKAMMMKEVEKTKAWYAYGIGMVKEITFDKNDKVVSTMTLNAINW